jgi:hypothetical protein
MTSTNTTKPDVGIKLLADDLILYAAGQFDPKAEFHEPNDMIGAYLALHEAAGRVLTLAMQETPPRTQADWAAIAAAAGTRPDIAKKHITAITTTAP